MHANDRDEGICYCLLFLFHESGNPVTVCLHGGILGNRMETARLTGHLAVAVEQGLITCRLCSKGRSRLDSRRSALSHRNKRLGRLYGLLRRGLLIGKTGLE